MPIEVSSTTTVTISSDDLGTYLGTTVDANRANYLIAQAINLCTSIVNPLPAGSQAVLLDVAGRAYINPANVQSETTGPSTASFGAVSGGMWLTRQNKATLRRLAGGGGAFTIDTTPADAASSLPPWDNGSYYWPSFDTP